MKNYIANGQSSLGIELGSTRIKAVLIKENGEILATGGFDWENRHENGIWTYALEDVWKGLQAAYANLNDEVFAKYGIRIKKLKAMGFSAMMHGYIAFNKENQLLVPFRTWRNNITYEATQILNKLFNHNIPQRWSVAHLYQAILNQEAHCPNVDFITTLAGYVHWQLTDEKVLGIGDAVGMFPINDESKDYEPEMLQKFDNLIKDKNFSWHLKDILPKVLLAGQDAGVLTAKGAALLDPSGNLEAGIKLCPPEGDAGTGMVATNTIKPTTGNISAGTSAFAMIVLEKPLSKVYEELDMVTTPSGYPVAMAHSNNCSTDLNSWVGIFAESLEAFGFKVDKAEVYKTLFNKALEGDYDCDGILSYCFHSGEHVVGLTEGRPLVVKNPDKKFNLANFILSHLYTAFGAMKFGMDILMKEEKVKISQILAHGGIFKTPVVAQKILSASLGVPVAVMNTASEGGAWGIALLANYLSYAQEQSLESYLDELIFDNADISVLEAEAEWHEGYETFFARYKNGISIEKEAVAKLL